MDKTVRFIKHHMPYIVGLDNETTKELIHKGIVEEIVIEPEEGENIETSRVGKGKKKVGYNN